MATSPKATETVDHRCKPLKPWARNKNPSSFKMRWKQIWHQGRDLEQHGEVICNDNADLTRIQIKFTSVMSPTFKNIYLFIYLFTHSICVDDLSACMSMHHAHAWCLQRQEDSPGTGVTDSWELPCGCWEWNPSLTH